MTTPVADPPASYGEALRDRIEPWMDVLFVGLSPEVLAGGQFPGNLTTVRQSGSIPADPWDVVFMRCDPAQPQAVPTGLERASNGLRCGGQIGLVVPPSEEPESGPESLAEALGSCTGSVEVIRPRDGSLLVLGRRKDAGRLDLVGLRRTLRELADDVDRLESVLEHVGERRASERPVEGGWSIKEMVGHLGDMDRFVRLPTMLAIRDRTGALPEPFDALDAVTRQGHDRRKLAEMVTRFRHCRYQMLEFLDRLAEADFLQVIRAPNGSEETLANALRGWLRQEQQAFVQIDERLR